jgi:hypothetical protein
MRLIDAVAANARDRPIPLSFLEAEAKGREAGP